MKLQDKIKLVELLQEKKRRFDENKIYFKYFQEDTPLAIKYYPKHQAFFNAGKHARQRLLIAANRVGKTESAGLYEVVCHAIDWYPDWWDGRRLSHKENIRIWCAGDTRKTVRDILQKKLLGENLALLGTGLIPKANIIQVNRAPGVAEAIDTITVRRANGGITTIFLKSYDAGRETFQGTEADVILLDEEPPYEIYEESLLRTTTNKGIVLLTFTPLRGMTQLIQEFYNTESENKVIITATWDDVPHLDEKTKKELWDSISPFQRDARTKGIPSLGSGSIYPVSFDDILVDPFPIPDYWKKVYALDVGFGTTACIFGAINPDNNMIYLYDELYEKEKQPHEYARNIKLRGDWIPGVIDPAADNRTSIDGRKIIDLLRQEGLILSKATNAVEAGIYDTWQKLSLGQLKVFKTLANFQNEYKIYHRDEKGNIVKEKDHLMDCMRYLVVSGISIAKSQEKKKKDNSILNRLQNQRDGWMG